MAFPRFLLALTITVDSKKCCRLYVLRTIMDPDGFPLILALKDPDQDPHGKYGCPGSDQNGLITYRYGMFSNYHLLLVSFTSLLKL